MVKSNDKYNAVVTNGSRNAVSFLVKNRICIFLFMIFLFSPVFSAYSQQREFKYKSEYVFLKHAYSGKYLCSGENKNGGKFWMWGPIPSGHEERYTFLMEFAGDNKFFLKHVYSGKYLCSGESKNGGKFWMWGPIPPGHEERYAFRFETINGNKSFLKHAYSGKYLCSGENKNGGKFWMWGPIPSGHENRYSFELIKNTMMNQAPVIDKITGYSYSNEFGTMAKLGEKIIINGKGFSAINKNNKIGLRNVKNSTIPAQSQDFIGEIDAYVASSTRLEAVIPSDFNTGLVYLWVYVEGKGHSNPFKLSIIPQASPPIEYSSNGDLEAADWCYILDDYNGTITFRAIIHNASKTQDWASKKEGQYAVGATVGSVHYEKKHRLPAAPEWTLKKDQSLLMGGVTLPFSEKNNYLFIGNWVLSHSEDSNINNNTNDGYGHAVYPGTAFKPGGAIYIKGKQCLVTPSN